MLSKRLRDRFVKALFVSDTPTGDTATHESCMERVVLIH